MLKMDTKTLSTFFTKVIEDEGIGIQRPTDGSVCTVSLNLSNVGNGDEKILNAVMSTPMNGVRTINVGDGAFAIDVLLEMCLRTMRKGEIATVVLSPEFIAQCNIQLDKTLTFRIELLNFIHNQTSVWEQGSEDLINNAMLLKNQGVELYKTNSILWAFHKFSKALKLLIAVIQENLNDDTRKIYKDLKLACYLNLAACQMKTSNFMYVIFNCDKALQLEANNIKALFRRGVAYSNLTEYAKSIDDLSRTLSLDPRNKAASYHLKIAKERFIEHEKAYIEVVKKMFR